MNVQTLLTFYLINSQAPFKDRNINEEIANSLIYVIEKYYEPRDSAFIICLSYERENTRDFYQDLSEILFRSYDNIKTQIVVKETQGLELKPIPTVKGKLTNFIFHMLVVDSVKSFLNIDLASKVKNYDTNEFYHIFLHNKDRFLDNDIRNILEYCWSNYMINVNVVIQTAAGDIIVYTYFPFNESHCNEVIPVEINRFQNGVMVNPDLFPEKLQNMHKCPVRVTPFHTPPFFSLNDRRNGTTDDEAINGFEGLLLRELSLLMNFTIEIILPPKKDERGHIFNNFSTGAIDMLEQTNQKENQQQAN
ncbi:uncharacterized protein LOC129944777 [Eupeodes corollae]|uniref:uncharacterized protein LOC129944777 n=1 Tax=Eupeodes corollae TaxID=290404 RepID=UPI002492FF1B|nr:uncharacterized protein LOC129944777 [Eupeodes corollae]